MSPREDKVRVMICKPSTGKIVEFGRYSEADAEQMAARLRKHGMDARVEQQTPTEAIGGT